MRYVYLLSLAVISTVTYAEEMERHTMTSCAYQAGTAEEIQRIRQQEGDDWATFESKVKKIYKQTQGLSDLLAIAKRVYLQPADTSIEDINADMFQACVARTQGTEPKV